MSSATPELLPDLLTVTEAAERFGRSERTVARVVKAAGTAAQGRQVKRQTKSGRRTATVYPADVLAGLLDADTEEVDRSEPERESGTTAAQTQATSPADGGSMVANTDLLRRSEVAEARALLLESERDTLRTALARSQENERAALAQLDQARREYSVMIAATAAGRIMPVKAPDASETEGTRQTDVVATPAPSEGKTAHSAEQETGKEPAKEEATAPVVYSAQNRPPRQWWEFWKS